MVILFRRAQIGLAAKGGTIVAMALAGDEAVLRRALHDERALLAQTYAAATPLSGEASARAREALPGGNTRSNLHFSPYPPVFQAAEKGTLTDLDGHSYADFINDFTVALQGHSNAVIINAVHDLLAKGMSYGGRTQAEDRLASLIKSRITSIDRLRFTNSGTEANLYAFLAARAYTGREAIFVFEGGYHGGVFNFASKDLRLRAPFDIVSSPYNDIEAFDRAFNANAGRIACVAMELILNSGGCVPARREFARHVEARCREAGVVFLVDEVMTSRIAYGGMQSLYGVTPDMTTLGKIIGGGFSIGAFGGRADIMAMFDVTKPGALFHSGSFNNNVFSMNAGVAALSEVLTEEAIARVNAAGDAFRIRLNAALAKADVPLVFSGLGSVAALHIGRTAPERFQAPPLSAEVRSLFHLFMLLEGFWIAERGMIALSLETTQAQMDAFELALARFCARYEALLQSLEAAPAIERAS